jgi:hypothetical protein
MLKITYIIVANLLFISSLYSGWNGNIKFGYDTNIMKYSEKENPISSNMIQLSQIYRTKISNIFPRKTKLKISMKKSIYELSQKSNYSYSIDLKQPLGNYRYLSFNYKYIDDIYLRKYADLDQGALGYIYEGSNCYFDNSKISLNYERPLSNKNSRVSFSLLYETQFYNKYFTEFDLELSGLKVKYTNDMYPFKYSISWRTSDAKNITLNDVLISAMNADRGYKENSINIVLKYPTIVPNENYGFSLILNQRVFSSNILEDNLHYNRTHQDTQYTVWRSFYLFGIKNKIFLKYRARNTSSNYSWVEELKTFNKFNMEHVVYF